MLYNHAYTFVFSLISSREDGADVRPVHFREALVRRLATITDDELLEMMGAPEDSYDYAPGEQIPAHQSDLVVVRS